MNVSLSWKFINDILWRINLPTGLKEIKSGKKS